MPGQVAVALHIIFTLTYSWRQLSWGLLLVLVTIYEILSNIILLFHFDY